MFRTPYAAYGSRGLIGFGGGFGGGFCTLRMYLVLT